MKATSTEMRPPRDIDDAQSESLLSNVTKEHLFEYLPRHSNNEASRKYSTFMSKGGSKCRKSIENNKMCFECFVEGERRKECMYASKPKHHFESFSTSKKSSSKNPYAFEMPPATKSKYSHSHYEYEPELRAPKRNKNKTNDRKRSKNGDQIKFDVKAAVRVIPNHEQMPHEAALLDFNPNNKQNQPQSQPPRVVPDIIYGTMRSHAEPLALLYKSDLKFGTDNSNQNIPLQI